MIKEDPTCDPYYDPPDWVCPKWRLVLSFFWEVIRKPPGERKYVNKLDRGILFYLMLSYMTKSLDQKNISNAYVSGMKEDLNLNGDQYNLFTTIFNIGYLCGSIPSQIVLTWLRPSYSMPICECFWTVCVMCMSRATSARYIYGFRFLQGWAESICYPTMMMILGSWYRPDEIAKRVVIWDMTWSMAAMFSGYLQAAVYTNLNGVGGYAGWQWLFIVDGCISLPIGLIGFLCIPDFPDNTRAIYFTERDIQYSLRRMAEVGKKGSKKMTIKRFIGFFTTWRFWAFITPYSVYIVGAGDYFNLWLKGMDYSVKMINYLPTIGNAVALVSGYLFAIFSDLTRWRWQLAMVALVPYLFGNLVLGIWDGVPFGLKFAANIVPNVGASFFSIFMAYISEVFQDDTEMRGYLPAIGNVIWYAMYAWFPIVFFDAADSPKFKKRQGYLVAFALAVVNFVSIYICHWAHMREVKLKGLVKNKYGLWVAREMLIDYDGASQTGSDAAYEEATYEIGEKMKADPAIYEIDPNQDIERDSDLIRVKSNKI
ncbi:major facilitator superfamily domain-containing protein [Myxozyma melibiosi]|uniref:Major facilitator superfamily domain-containing protein n=1 Tax=Myxozyma melibiosi TaxID=54550 RepID=A0ABR1F1I8_9ASCO